MKEKRKQVPSRRTFKDRYVNDDPVYKIWCGMKSRCYNNKTANYKYYGGRGITVCDEWKDSFINFFNWSMDNGYNSGLTIDRINGGLSYCPENCRWVTMKVQNYNKKMPKKYNKSLRVIR